LGLPPPESAEYDIQLEGSPYDRAFFLALLVAGIIVLLSMAHGLELRVPYVDEEIVEYFERLPASLKVRNGSRKWLHRRVCQSFLPESILKRPKRGFAGNVVDDWFRRAIDSKMNETLLDRNPRIYQYLRPSVVRELFEQHTSGRQDNHKILFSLVVFGEWLRAHEAPVAPLS
jgi:asparagine synthase (glutamine-hydrolysing)